MGQYKSNNNVIYNCHYHVVFTPKYRRSVLINGVDVRLKNIIADECSALGASLIEIEVMPDHVHLLVGCDPQFGIATLIKRLKGKSSNLLRKEFPWLKSRIPTLWTNAYFVATTGSVSLEVVKKYIENQKRV